jgi:hypothetical protein
MNPLPFFLALPIHELGHVLAAGGIRPPYFQYAPVFDPLTVVVILPAWTPWIAIAGLLVTLPMLVKWRSPWLAVWLLFMARWDLLKIAVHLSDLSIS